MAYKSYAIASLSDVPALFGTFAHEQGFTTDLTDPNKPKVKHPSYASAVEFQMVYEEAETGYHINSDCYQRISLRDTGTTDPAPGTTMICPIMNDGSGDNGHKFIAATKVHFMGGTTPQPFIAVVVEFGDNLYRHLYYGYMDKVSDYDGGEVLSGSTFSYCGGGYNRPNFLDGRYHVYPFMGWSDFWGSRDPATGNGGVRVIHADNPVTWRRFGMTTRPGISFNDTLDDHFASDEDGNGVVIGGAGDSITTMTALQGQARYAGENFLTPFNLYAGHRVSGSMFFKAIGAPVGVRMVDMTHVDPGTVITAGTDQWRVFPIFSKQTSGSYSRAANSYYPKGESSWVLGQAYLISG